MTLNELYLYAEQNGIETFDWNIRGSKGLALKMGYYYIALNRKLIESESDERIVLAHELGQCMTDQLHYIEDIKNPLYKQNIQKAERRAKNFSYQLIAPVSQIIAAAKFSDDEQEIAELLDVDLNTLKGAVQYYKRKGLM